MPIIVRKHPRTKERPMQTVYLAELQTNLRDYLEQVRNGAEFLVRDRHRAIAYLLPLAAGDDLDQEEETLVAAGLMKLPMAETSNDFLKLLVPRVSRTARRAACRAERDVKIDARKMLTISLLHMEIVNISLSPPGAKRTRVVGCPHSRLTVPSLLYPNQRTSYGETRRSPPIIPISISTFPFLRTRWCVCECCCWLLLGNGRRGCVQRGNSAWG
jgi:antitoxin (DNA-binding transcriptional repressor) of toxin-antitoxin stability system